MNSRRANNRDIEIGKKIAALRISRGMTIKNFAERIGVTHQQAHKYERGDNRITVGRLYNIAHALEVPVAYFFDETRQDTTSPEVEMHRRCIDLVRNFSEIPKRRQQDIISMLVRVLAEK